ncbi:hypothetical protein [Krasilnikovia sp. MM14-A1259]|uniref:hypothetical protein n=1 Tax=Krasilnikovia sp. MM14-A1259 TaxID=3373539 RepID=UPI00399C6A79
MDAVIEYAMQTPDGAWCVEVVKRGRSRWYRVRHDDNEIDWLSIAAVHRILADAGIDLADLAEVQSAAQPVSAPRYAQPQRRPGRAEAPGAANPVPGDARHGVA